jgi:hypothetical protein
MSSLAEKVKELAEIASSVPDNLQAMCFELLLRDHLESARNNTGDSEKRSPESAKSQNVDGALPDQAQPMTDQAAPAQADLLLTDLHVKARKFMDKHGVTIVEVNNLFYKEDDKVLPLYEDLKTTRMSEGQVRIALLHAFHRALSDGEFVAEVDLVRSECRDRKVLDAGNFAATFRNNSALFDFETYDKETKSIRLSEAGKDELREVIKKLQ